MHTTSLLFGTTVLAVALGLENHRRRTENSLDLTRSEPFPPESSREHRPPGNRFTELDKVYVEKRRLGRCWTNGLIALIGLLALIAGGVGKGHSWLILWSLIPLLLSVIVALAMMDAWRTHTYLLRKIPELQTSSLGSERHPSLDTVANSETNGPDAVNRS